jgi:hypothetical protein
MNASALHGVTFKVPKEHKKSSKSNHVVQEVEVDVSTTMNGGDESKTKKKKFLLTSVDDEQRSLVVQQIVNIVPASSSSASSSHKSSRKHLRFVPGKPFSRCFSLVEASMGVTRCLDQKDVGKQLLSSPPRKKKKRKQ